MKGVQINKWGAAHQRVILGSPHMKAFENPGVTHGIFEIPSVVIKPYSNKLVNI